MSSGSSRVLERTKKDHTQKILTMPWRPESKSEAETWATDVPISAPSGTVASYVDDMKKGTLSFTSGRKNNENNQLQMKHYWNKSSNGFI